MPTMKTATRIPGGSSSRRKGVCRRLSNTFGRETPHEGPAVKDVADHGLENRGGELIDERDEADFGETDAEVGLEHGIDGGDDRLEEVVETVGGAEGEEDVEGGHLGQPPQFMKKCHDVDWCMIFSGVQR